MLARVAVMRAAATPAAAAKLAAEPSELRSMLAAVLTWPTHGEPFLSHAAMRRSCRSPLPATFHRVRYPEVFDGTTRSSLFCSKGSRPGNGRVIFAPVG